MTIIGTVVDTTWVLGKSTTITDPAQVDQSVLSQYAMKAQSDSESTARDTANSYFKDETDSVSIATAVMIYNATGVPLSYRSSYDFHGHIGKYSYDTTIANGVWSVFIHVKAEDAATGSIGVVGYNIEDTGLKPVAVIGWNNPYGSSTNTALGDCWSPGGYADTQWTSIENLMTSATGGGDAIGVKYGYSAAYSMGQDDNAILTITVTQLGN